MQSSGSDISWLPSAGSRISTFEPSISSSAPSTTTLSSPFSPVSTTVSPSCVRPTSTGVHVRLAVDDREHEISVLPDLDRLARDDDRDSARSGSSARDCIAVRATVSRRRCRRSRERRSFRCWRRRNCRGSRACPRSWSSSPAASRPLWRRSPSLRAAPAAAIGVIENAT